MMSSGSSSHQPFFLHKILIINTDLVAVFALALVPLRLYGGHKCYSPKCGVLLNTWGERKGRDWSTWGLSSLCPDPALWSGGGSDSKPPWRHEKSFFLSSELNAVSADSDSLWTLQGAANLPLMNEAVRGWQFRGHCGWCQETSPLPPPPPPPLPPPPFLHLITQPSAASCPPAHVFEACCVGVWSRSIAVCTCLKGSRGKRKSKSSLIERNGTLTRCWDWFSLAACWPHLTLQVPHDLNILFLLSVGISHSWARHTPRQHIAT